MIKKILLLVAVVFVTSLSAQAQDYPKVEFWGTYSIFVADIDVLNNESLHGFGLGLQGNLNKTFGIVGEFSAAHGASGPVSIRVPGAIKVIPELDTRVRTFLFGPRVSYRTKQVTVFAHVLAGGANSKLDLENSGIDATNTEFAMAIGGGLDVNLGNRFAIRAAQFDFLPIHTDINQRLVTGGGGSGSTGGSSSSWTKNTRFQTGFVFKF